MTKEKIKDAIAEKYPDLLHYTRFEGLAGILRAQTLWATHFSSLNDSSEIRQFSHHLPEILKRAIGKAGANFATTDSAAREFADRVYKTWIESEVLPHPYIFSFSYPEHPLVASHGQMSQWHAYCHGAGYALVFDTSKFGELFYLEKAKWDESYSIFVGDVVYSHETVKMQEELGDYMEELAEGLRGAVVGEEVPDLWHPFIYCACRYKHWGFYEEREVRLVGAVADERHPKLPADQPMKPTHEVVTGGRKIKTIRFFDEITKIPERALPIARIIVGPGQDQANRHQHLVRLLDELKLKIPILNSEIPYV